MRIIITILITFIVAAGCVEYDIRTVEFKGEVVDSTTLAPIARAWVKANAVGETKYATTDNSGTFSIKMEVECDADSVSFFVQGENGNTYTHESGEQSFGDACDVPYLKFFLVPNE